MITPVRADSTPGEQSSFKLHQIETIYCTIIRFGGLLDTTWKCTLKFFLMSRLLNQSLKLWFTRFKSNGNRKIQLNTIAIKNVWSNFVCMIEKVESTKMEVMNLFWQVDRWLENVLSSKTRIPPVSSHRKPNKSGIWSLINDMSCR